eukprot:COSAG04_NODE_464_length_13939_cov_11.061922_16_plen_74_part_01
MAHPALVVCKWLQILRFSCACRLEVSNKQASKPFPSVSSKNNTYKGLRYLNATHNYKLVRYDDDVNFEELFDLS